MEKTGQVKLYNGHPITIVRKKKDGLYHWATPRGGKWDSPSRKFVKEYFKSKGMRYVIMDDLNVSLFESEED